jgi:beta-glucosidase-like glycosyl hydrolase
MADDPTKEPAEKPEPTDDPDAGAKKALDAERKARRDADKRATELEARLKEIEDKDKSESDKLREEHAALTQRLAAAEAKALRAEIATAKGLTPAQAKRLVGSTQEELEADADEILEAFPVSPAAKPPPSDRPKPTLRGGNDPSDEPEELDPRKLADLVPRD